MGETIDANGESAAPPPRLSTRVAALVGALLIVVIAAVVLAQSGDDPDAAPGSPDPSPTSPAPGVTDPDSGSTDDPAGTTTPTVIPTAVDSTDTTVLPGSIDPVSEPSAEDATFSVTNFLERIPAAINAPAVDDTSDTDDPESSTPFIADIVTGAMADEVLATATEFEAMGWTQTGTPEIVDMQVVRAPTPEAPLDAVVEVCLDSAGVQILDESGRNVRGDDTPDRTLNIFVLRLVDGTWLVAERTFPDDPDC